jgi:arylsulfatase A
MTRWIEAHQRQPFFLFFASHDIHVPRAPHERFVGKSGQGPRGDSILEFDWSVGEILATLDRLGLSENTLVVLCSDNGPVLDDGYKDQAVEMLGNHRPAGPYRGGKYSVWEGGTRTPFVVRWRGRIAPGVSDQVVCTIDLATSFAALTGAIPPENGFLDSFNVLPALLGEPGAQGRDHLVQQDNAGKRFGLRAGEWKLVRQPRGGDRATGKNSEMIESLFHLTEDISEQNDLASSNAEQLLRLRKVLDNAIQSAGTRRR